MAEVSFLHLPDYDHDIFLDEISAVDSFTFWPHNENADRKNQVNFVMELFHQRVEESNLMLNHEIVSNESTFGVTEENYDVGLNNFEIELGLGFVDQEHGNNDEYDYNCGGFVVSDCGDDFYIARRNSDHNNIVNDNNNGSRNYEGSLSRVSGTRTIWIESDSDNEIEGIDKVLMGMNLHCDEEEEDFGVDNVNDDNGDGLSVPICWDSFHLEEEEEEDNGEVNHDFEWEEVNDGVDEREVLSFVVNPEEDEEGSISVLNFSGLEEDGERGRRLSNLDWEVLLNVDNLDRNSEMENEGGPYFGDHDDGFIYTAEYEMMFGQFVDGETAGLGRPPASKAVVEKLPSVVITKEDVIDEKSLCAVCKEQIEVGEEGKQLPCCHRYHGDCIIPWLGIRNTCPVCRFELPTDDPDYEQWRLRRSAHVV